MSPGAPVPAHRVRRGLIVGYKRNASHVNAYVVRNPGGEGSTTCVLAPLNGCPGRLVGVPKEDLLYADMDLPEVRQYISLNEYSRTQQQLQAADPRSPMRNYSREESRAGYVPEWDE